MAQATRWIQIESNIFIYLSKLHKIESKYDVTRRVPGSAKQSDSLAMSLFKSNMLTPVNKLVCTPVVPSSIGKNGKSFDVNPIW